MGLEKVGVEAIVRGLGKFRTDMAGIQSTVNRVGKSIGSVVRKAALLGGVALAGFGVVAVKMAGDFDAAMTASLAIMSDVSDAMRKDMADAAREVSKVTTFSAKEAADAYYFLASAGMDASEALGSMPVVAQFAQAGMFSLAKATDLVTDAQSALGLRSEDTTQNLKEMTRVGDVLVKMNQMANASVEQFATSLTQKGASALKGANKALEEGAGVLAYWADQGLKGEQAGNALAGMLQMLPKIASVNADAFKKYGVEIYDASGTLKSFADIAAEFAPILEDLTDAQRAQAFEQMGINRLLADTILKMKGGEQAIRDYTEAAWEASGATKEVADKQLQTFNAQLSLLRSALEDVVIAVGTELLPKLMSLVTTIRENMIPALKEWWQEHLPEIKAGFQAMGEGIKTVSGALVSFGRWILDNKSRLVTAISLIGLAFAWTNPLLMALVGTAGLVFALGLFGQKSEEVASDVEAAFVQMRATVLRVIADVIHGLAKAADAYMTVTTLGLNKLAEWAGAADNMAQGYYDLADSMYADAEASQALVDAWDDQIAAAERSGKAIREAFLGRIGAGAFIGPLSPEQVAIIKEQAAEIRAGIPIGPLPLEQQRIVDLARQLGENAAGALAEGLSAGLDDEMSAGGDAGSEAEETMASLGERLSSTFTEELLAGIGSLPPQVVAVISEAGEAIERFSAALRPGIREVFVDINALAVLGPDVPDSYRAAQEAVGRLEKSLLFVNGVLRTQESDLYFLESALWDAEFAYDTLKGTLAALESELGTVNSLIADLLRTPIAGTYAYEDALFDLEQRMAEIRLEINRMLQAGAPEEAVEGLRDQLRKLGLEAEQLRLEEQLDLGPLQKQLDDLERPAESPFQTLIDGVKELTEKKEGLEERIGTVSDLLETQEEKVDDARSAWEKQTEVIDATRALQEKLISTLQTLQGVLVDETQAALSQYRQLIFGTEIVKVTLKGLEDKIRRDLQPAFDRINTGHAVGQLNALEGAAAGVASAIAGMPGVVVGGNVPSYQYGGTVPGPAGAPMLAVVHGQEQYLGVGGTPSPVSEAPSFINYGRMDFRSDAPSLGALIAELDRSVRSSGIG